MGRNREVRLDPGENVFLTNGAGARTSLRGSRDKGPDWANWLELTVEASRHTAVAQRAEASILEAGMVATDMAGVTSIVCLP